MIIQLEKKYVKINLSKEDILLLINSLYSESTKQSELRYHLIDVFDHIDDKRNTKQELLFSLEDLSVLARMLTNHNYFFSEFIDSNALDLLQNLNNAIQELR